ncbi:gibberellin-regulated protein 2-like [Vigna umbellata]|uniref:gibberellin-regulated protein 2-like n=1 Tax=Vigna umbellata TaxID=87088 RepID=UPI001F5F8794|nr:gibberellin-regulated protein 2-like [Vigna umbellata]
MALTRNTVVMAIFFLILIQELGIYNGNEHMVAANKIDCDGKCKNRCRKAGRYKMCIRACNSCCKRCNCVPPGTSGNTHFCPCYATLTTHGGKLKCP